MNIVNKSSGNFGKNGKEVNQMKKILSVVVSLVIIFAFTAVSFAAEQEAAPAAPAEKMEKTHHMKKAHHRRIMGEVTAVDAAAGTITLKHKKGDVTISVDAKTKIMAGKEKKSIGDVKAGEKVTVKYKEEDGKNVATGVYIKTAAKKAKKAEKKEAAPMQKEEAPAEAPAN
jgi:Cu/Ag efflux protein CusF